METKKEEKKSGQEKANKKLQVAKIPSEASTKKAQKTAEAKPVKIKPKIPFSVWFNNKMKANKIKYWQDETLKVYFKKQGLTEMEYEDTYEEHFKKF